MKKQIQYSLVAVLCTPLFCSDDGLTFDDGCTFINSDGTENEKRSPTLQSSPSTVTPADLEMAGAHPVVQTLDARTSDTQTFIDAESALDSAHAGPASVFDDLESKNDSDSGAATQKIADHTTPKSSDEDDSTESNSSPKISDNDEFEIQEHEKINCWTKFSTYCGETSKKLITALCRKKYRKN